MLEKQNESSKVAVGECLSGPLLKEESLLASPKSNSSIIVPILFNGVKASDNYKWRIMLS